MSESQIWYTGYAIEQEDQGEIEASATEARMLSFREIPDEVDPRKHPLYGDQWLKVEDQKSQGSCQGQSLTECGEYCYGMLHGKVIQLSRQYAYLESQRHDGLLGRDVGSTLSGGTKCFRDGVCLEKTGPYHSRYPGARYVTQAMRDEAKKYRLNSHTVMKSPEEIRDYIGSGIGIVQIGISWNNSMTPDRNGCIHRWSSGGGGGHAVVFCGYLKEESIGCKTSSGWVLLLKNSWSKRWGRGGYAYVDPAAVRQMLGHRWTVMLGRSDMKTPEPRPDKVDWCKDGGKYA